MILPEMESKKSQNQIYFGFFLVPWTLTFYHRGTSRRDGLDAL